MKELNVTIIGDGSSDRALINIVRWVLEDKYPKLPLNLSFADFGSIPNPPPKSDVAGQLEWASRLFPFDLLVYHRDAESIQERLIAQRKKEVLGKIDNDARVVVVVPIKMMEAWLLIDEMAIKKAAGNRNFKEPISLPKIKQIEKLSDPKETLHSLIKKATNLKKRRLASFNVNKAVHLVSESIDDYTTLRSLKAFQVFEDDLNAAIAQLGGT